MYLKGSKVPLDDTCSLFVHAKKHKTASCLKIIQTGKKKKSSGKTKEY